MSGWAYLVYEPADADLGTAVENALERAVPPAEDAHGVMSDKLEVGDDNVINLNADPGEPDADDERYADAEAGAVNELRRYDGHGDTEIVYVGGYNVRFEWKDGDEKNIGGINYSFKAGERTGQLLRTIVENRDDYDTAVIVTADDTGDTASADIYCGGQLVDGVTETQTPPPEVAVYGLMRAYVQREHDVVVPAVNALYLEEYRDGFETPEPIDEETIEEWFDEAGDLVESGV